MTETPGGVQIYDHPVRSITKNLKTGATICGICGVEFVLNPDDEFGMFPLGAVEERVCVEPLGRRLLNPIRMFFLNILIIVTQTPRIAQNRFMWFVFGEMYSSGCFLCGGTGKATGIEVSADEIVGIHFEDGFGTPPTEGDIVSGATSGGSGTVVTSNCSFCNGYHD